MNTDSFVLDPPTLSTAERDRRWAAVRAMMRQNQVDCLLVFGTPIGSPNRSADSYLTNGSPGCTVIFPLEGEPVALDRGASIAGSWLQALDYDEGVWITDVLFGPTGKLIQRVIKEMKLENGRIGTIGVHGGPNLTPNGWTPQATWQVVANSLPDAEFTDLSKQFELVWLKKSAEEIAIYRYVSQVCEEACQAMLDTTRAGVNEAEVWTAIMHAFHRHGASEGHSLIFHSGNDNLSWGSSRWHYRAMKPRTIQDGDVVLSEMMPIVGGIEAQAQMAIAVGKVDDAFLRAAAVARESYDAAISVMRAGITFRELAEAMQEPILRAGAWHLTPHVHSVNPISLVGPVTEGLDKSIRDRFRYVEELGPTGMDVVLEAGMMIQLEPNAAFGRQQVNIGGNVIIWEDGCEELNSLPNELRFVG